MRQYQIRITDLAEEDLENVGDYIAYELKNPSAAESTVSEIEVDTIYIVRTLHMLVDSKAWLYRIFGL